MVVGMAEGAQRHGPGGVALGVANGGQRRGRGGSWH